MTERANNTAANCSLCGGPNDCAVACGGDTSRCWCAGKDFPTALLKRASAIDAGRCLCRNCLKQEELRRNER